MNFKWPSLDILYDNVNSSVTALAEHTFHSPFDLAFLMTSLIISVKEMDSYENVGHLYKNAIKSPSIWVINLKTQSKGEKTKSHPYYYANYC